MKPRSAIQTDLFADQHQKQAIDRPGDTLAEIGRGIDFDALAVEVDRISRYPISPQGGRPPFPSATIARREMTWTTP